MVGKYLCGGRRVMRDVGRVKIRGRRDGRVG